MSLYDIWVRKPREEKDAILAMTVPERDALPPMDGEFELHSPEELVAALALVSGGVQGRGPHARRRLALRGQK